jgi:hypothetical protein
MLESKEFPLILSPNLGCPEIVCAEALQAGGTFRLIIAMQDGGFSRSADRILGGTLFLRSSYGPAREIPVQVAGQPQEIVEWNLLSSFPDVAATREMISSELHYNVLGNQTRYWKLEGSIAPRGRAAPANKNKKVSTGLFDLVLKDKASGQERVNHHAVQVVERFPSEARFIHLTDLHVAQRNDEILSEVLTARSEMTRDSIRQQYVNFNENLRAFIRRANEMAREGQLDFVVITGDLVDFAFPGWDASRDQSENNWKTFVHIVTGGGKEGYRGNPGIQVPIFTSTGNHDWRLYPYDPKLHCDIFGLEKRIIQGYRYRYFDSSEYPDSNEARAARQFLSEASGQLKTGILGQGTVTKMKTAVGRMAASRVIPWVLPVLGVAGLGGAALQVGGASPIAPEWLFWTVLAAVVEGPLLIAKGFVKRWACRFADFIVSNPLLAEPRALHYYLRHINPYLDYAFRYGDHCFIVMDTGSDVLTGDLLDGKRIWKLKRMSIKDNILGGSPDSRAFDSQRKYYNWSQIVWLENVLAACNRHDGNGRTFLFLHAPPVNLPRRLGHKGLKLREAEREKTEKHAWINECDCNLTFGTVNHYLRQFFYLCMGYCEGELGAEEAKPGVRKVDVVFCGHAHTNIEFRIAKEWIREDGAHAIRIYCDAYSRIRAADRDGPWWHKHTPLIVQTAACGLQGPRAEKPPYYRLVHIDGTGQISDFSSLDREGAAVGWSEPYSVRTLGQWLALTLATCLRWFGRCWYSVQKRWVSFIRRMRRRYGYAG